MWQLNKCKDFLLRDWHSVIGLPSWYLPVDMTYASSEMLNTGLIGHSYHDTKSGPLVVDSI